MECLQNLGMFVSLYEIQGISRKRQPIVASMHHFGGKGASPGIETTYPFMKLSHDIVCLLVIQAFE